MNKGVEILLARMESHPEEFLRDKDRWEHLFNHYKKYMAEEDKEAFWDKLCEVRTQEFTEKVMKTLFDDKKEEAKRHKVASIQEIVDAGLDLAWKEAYTKYTLDTLNYVTKGRLMWKDKK
jgi:hypothetical protein